MRNRAGSLARGVCGATFLPWAQYALRLLAMTHRVLLRSFQIWAARRRHELFQQVRGLLHCVVGRRDTYCIRRPQCSRRLFGNPSALPPLAVAPSVLPLPSSSAYIATSHLSSVATKSIICRRSASRESRGPSAPQSRPPSTRPGRVLLLLLPATAAEMASHLLLHRNLPGDHRPRNNRGAHRRRLERRPQAAAAAAAAAVAADEEDEEEQEEQEE